MQSCLYLVPILCASLFPCRGEGLQRSTSVRGLVCNVFRDDVDEQFVYLTLADQLGQQSFVSTKCKDAYQELQKLKKLVGCEISLAGFPFKLNQSTARRVLKEIVVRYPDDQIVVHATPASDIFDAPDLLRSPPDYRTIDSCGPRTARGTVIARWHGDMILLRAGTNAIKIELSDKALPELGDAIEVTGRVTTDLYGFNLEQAQWRKMQLPRKPNEPATRQSLHTIFSHGNIRVINADRHGKTLCVSGMLKSILSDEFGRNRFLVEDGDYQIIVDCSALPHALDGLKEGSLIEVTGVGVLKTENWHPGMTFPKVSGLFLVPRSKDDIRVLRQPPWLTPSRMLGVVLVLLAVLAGILVWNVSLRLLVARKSRALLREQAFKLTETLKIAERTRLAADLHDFHCQNLTAISYQISSARNSCEGDPHKTRDLLTTAARMLKSCRTDLRRCLWDLRNDALDNPDFATAIRDTVAPVAGAAKVTVRFIGHRAQISDSTAHAILSILRELTANAVIHGKATAVRIAGEQRPQKIRFSVQDNGCGFDTTARPGQNDGHFGLDGIQERMVRQGGTFTLDSTPGKGTYARLTISHAAPHLADPQQHSISNLS